MPWATVVDAAEAVAELQWYPLKSVEILLEQIQLVGERGLGRGPGLGRSKPEAGDLGGTEDTQGSSVRLLVPLDGAQRRHDERFYVRVPLLPTVSGRDVVHDPQRVEIGAKALGPSVPAVLLDVDLDDRVLRELASLIEESKGHREETHVPWWPLVEPYAGHATGLAVLC
ncbi:hypothetical protein [Streptomyces sp. NPDC059272]|uniref:hypothetical protein n=1 Tax=Streptomyces sp. NPDC059272 TaxID=3346800 RepID=UPI003692A138